jgi:hypothetical protein
VSKKEIKHTEVAQTQFNLASCITEFFCDVNSRTFRHEFATAFNVQTSKSKVQPTLQACSRLISHFFYFSIYLCIYICRGDFRFDLIIFLFVFLLLYIFIFYSWFFFFLCYSFPSLQFRRNAKVQVASKVVRFKTGADYYRFEKLPGRLVASWNFCEPYADFVYAWRLSWFLFCSSVPYFFIFISLFLFFFYFLFLSFFSLCFYICALFFVTPILFYH